MESRRKEKEISLKEVKLLFKRNPRMRQFLPHNIPAFGSSKTCKFSTVDFYQTYFGPQDSFLPKEKQDPTLMKQILENTTRGYSQRMDVAKDPSEEEVYEEVEVTVVEDRPVAEKKGNNLLDLSFATEVLQGSNDPQLAEIYQKKIERFGMNSILLSP